MAEHRNERRVDFNYELGGVAGGASLARALARAFADCVADAAASSTQIDAFGQPYPTDEVRIRLRDCVRDYTETLRSAQEHPERVLKNVKQIMHDAAPSVESYSALAADVSRWCIEAYFEPEE